MSTPTQNQEWAGPFSVRCNPETVTLSVPLNAGTDDEHVLSFSSTPTYLRHIPPEVAADDRLAIENVFFSDVVKAGGRLTLLPGEAPPEPFEGDPRKAGIEQLRELAKALDLDPEGDKATLLARIDGYYRAHGEIFLKAERVQ